MVSREEILELVRAHAALEEPMETALWIRREDREAWLVELIPSLAMDRHPERPIAFNPGRSFRHPLKLIASNLDGLEPDDVLACVAYAAEIVRSERVLPLAS